MAAWSLNPAGQTRRLAEHGGPEHVADEWFGHEPGRFEEIRRRYIEELRNERPALTALRRRARKRTVTLVYSAHDTEHNDAVVLAEVLRRGLPKART